VCRDSIGQRNEDGANGSAHGRGARGNCEHRAEVENRLGTCTNFTRALLLTMPPAHPARAVGPVNGATVARRRRGGAPGVAVRRRRRPAAACDGERWRRGGLGAPVLGCPHADKAYIGPSAGGDKRGGHRSPAVRRHAYFLCAPAIPPLEGRAPFLSHASTHPSTCPLPQVKAADDEE
jgi:hypothetical protein